MSPRATTTKLFSASSVSCAGRNKPRMTTSMAMRTRSPFSMWVEPFLSRRKIVVQGPCSTIAVMTCGKLAMQTQGCKRRTIPTSNLQGHATETSICGKQSRRRGDLHRTNHGPWLDDWVLNVEIVHQDNHGFELQDEQGNPISSKYRLFGCMEDSYCKKRTKKNA